MCSSMGILVLNEHSSYVSDTRNSVSDDTLQWRLVRVVAQQKILCGTTNKTRPRCLSLAEKLVSLNKRRKDKAYYNN